jgi:hypothetical protein
MPTCLRFGLALVLGAAMLPACDDDNTKNNEAGDMSVADLSATVNGQGQVIAADVRATLPTPIGDIANAHQLIVLPTFPSGTPTPDFSNLVFSPGQSTGCSVTRYNLAAGKAPAANVNAGTITMSGLSPNLTVIGSATGVTLPEHPTAITCTNTAGAYNCVYGIDADGGTDGLSMLNTSASFFPPLPSGEQHPFPTDVNANLFFTLQGGSGYAPFEVSLGGGTDPIGTATITDIKVGATSVGTAIESLGGHLDGTQAVTFSYSCDGSTTTGSGCPAAGTAPLDTVALLMQTSQADRVAFAQPPTETKFGIGQCLDQSNDPAHAVTFSTDAFSALLSNSSGPDGGIFQAGGSTLIALVRIKAKVNVTPGSPMEVFAAGKGTLGIVNLQ